MIIYVVTNKINGKKYVGLTRRPLNIRRNAHLTEARRGARTPFHCAIRKYGEDAFTWDVVEFCETEESLLAAEVFWIASLASETPNGYNRTSGGQPGNHLHSPDVIARRVASFKETWRRRREAGTATREGRQMSNEGKAKLSERMKRSDLWWLRTPEAIAKSAASRSEAWRRKRDEDT
jgi:group I intron endonuclease